MLTFPEREEMRRQLLPLLPWQQQQQADTEDSSGLQRPSDEPANLQQAEMGVEDIHVQEEQPPLTWQAQHDASPVSGLQPLPEKPLTPQIQLAVAPTASMEGPLSVRLVPIQKADLHAVSNQQGAGDLSSDPIDQVVSELVQYVDEGAQGLEGEQGEGQGEHVSSGNGQGMAGGGQQGNDGEVQEQGGVADREQGKEGGWQGDTEEEQEETGEGQEEEEEEEQRGSGEEE